MKSRSDMRIIIDTREQEEYSFSCSSTKKKLAAGDYSIEGFENRVAVERKSLDDFVNTVIRAENVFTKNYVSSKIMTMPAWSSREISEIY